MRVWGEGSRGVGPIQVVCGDMEMRGEHRGELEQGVCSLLAAGGRAEGSHRTERAPEVDVRQKGTGGQQQSGCL